MRLNDIIGLFAALIGTTTTLLGAWSYIRSHNTKKEMIRGATAVVIIMVVILGSAVLISEATTIKVNGQEKVPVPGFLAPLLSKDDKTTPTPVLNSNQNPTSTPPEQGEPTKPSSPDSTPPAAPPTQPATTPVTSSTPPPASTPGVSITATP